MRRRLEQAIESRFLRLAAVGAALESSAMLGVSARQAEAYPPVLPVYSRGDVIKVTEGLRAEVETDTVIFRRAALYAFLHRHPHAEVTIIMSNTQGDGQVLKLFDSDVLAAENLSTDRHGDAIMECNPPGQPMCELKVKRDMVDDSGRRKQIVHTSVHEFLIQPEYPPA